MRFELRLSRLRITLELAPSLDWRGCRRSSPALKLARRLKRRVRAALSPNAVV